jgi:hypothetical protein
LRKRAAAELRTPASDPSATSTASMRKALHELEAYQIEHWTEAEAQIDHHPAPGAGLRAARRAGTGLTKNW